MVVEEAAADVERQPSAEQRPKPKTVLNQVKPVDEQSSRDDSEEQRERDWIINLTKQIQRTFQACSLTQPVCTES